jgi:hypothetical protein
MVVQKSRLPPLKASKIPIATTEPQFPVADGKVICAAFDLLPLVADGQFEVVFEKVARVYPFPDTGTPPPESVGAVVKSSKYNVEGAV